MTEEDREIQCKLKLLRHAEKTGDVARTCRYFSVGRSGWSMPSPFRKALPTRHRPMRTENPFPPNARAGQRCAERYPVEQGPPRHSSGKAKRAISRRVDDTALKNMLGRKRA